VLAGEFHHNRIRIRSTQVGRINPQLVNWSMTRRFEAVLGILARFDVESMIAAHFTPAEAANAYRELDQKEAPLQAVFDYR
jgi:hypothetical protein